MLKFNGVYVLKKAIITGDPIKYCLFLNKETLRPPKVSH